MDRNRALDNVCLLFLYFNHIWTQTFLLSVIWLAEMHDDLKNY